ncbi:MAG: DUF1570 domain-containing protein [Planctomycetota bacterium]|nr:DUF1570 domain-containing protein [Planctomycetota bacterium]
MKKLECAGCGAKLQVADFRPGQKVRCGRCSAVVVVPEESGAPPQERASPAPQSPGHKTRPKRPSFREGAPEEKTITLRRAIIAVTALLVLGGLAYFVGHETVEPVDPAAEERARVKAEYVKKRDTVDTKSAEKMFELYTWCGKRPDLFAEEADGLLRKILLADPAHAGAVDELRTLYDREHARAEELKTEGAWLALADFCDRYGLEAERNAAADSVLAVNKDNARANFLLGRVATTNEKGETIWEDKAVVEERARVERAKAERVEFEQKLGPRGLRIVERCDTVFKTLIDSSVAWKVCEPTPNLRIENDKWTIFDRNPYVYVMEKGGYSPEYLVDWVHDKLDGLRRQFMSMHAETLGLKEKEDDIIVVFYFKTRDSYLAKTGIREQAAAHYNTFWHALMIPHDADVAQRDEIMYHEGTHQLLDFASGYQLMRRRRFWFEEGMATLAETFPKWDLKSDPPTIFVNHQRLTGVRGAIRRKEAVALAEFIDMDYGAGSRVRSEIGYPQSWGMVFFLSTHESAEYRAKWLDYVRSEIAGKGGKKAFERIFGDVEAIEKEWKEFILSDELIKGE